MKHLAMFLIVAASGCGKEAAPAKGGPSGAAGTAAGAGTGAGASATPPAAGAVLTEAQLMAATVDACATFTSAQIQEAFGFARTGKSVNKRDIKDSSGKLLLRDESCEWASDKPLEFSFGVFLQVYPSADAAQIAHNSDKGPEMEPLLSIGDSATVSTQPNPASVILYVQAGNRRYTISASAMDKFDWADSRKKLIALADKVF